VPEGKRKPEAVPARLILVLGGISAFGPLCIDAYLPALPALGRDLSASASEVQITLTACLLGLAGGQLVAGPLSDVLGRRRPLIVGLVAFTVASIACALAPSVWLLVAMRLVQGIAGAAGIVIARAVARDWFEGTALARFFGLLMIVTGLAPILAPILGAQLLHFTSWRGVFVGLAGIGGLLLVGAAVWLPESLPAGERRSAGLRPTFRVFRELLADRPFLGYALSCGFPFAAMFAYIAGSPFVLQDIYGISPQEYSLVFGMNALGLVVAGQLGAALVHRVGPRRLLAHGLVGGAAGSAGLIASVAGHAGLPGVLPALFVVVAYTGLINPNASALALADHASAAGSASALLGVAQFVIGAAAAPIVGAAGTHTAVPMTVVIAVLSFAALLPFGLLTRQRRSPDTGAVRIAP
jgi:DHA1 family bicyclomycin/chloramphenicol resistance-like MFS transporter